MEYERIDGLIYYKLSTIYSFLGIDKIMAECYLKCLDTSDVKDGKITASGLFIFLHLLNSPKARELKELIKTDSSSKPITISEILDNPEIGIKYFQEKPEISLPELVMVLLHQLKVTKPEHGERVFSEKAYKSVLGKLTGASSKLQVLRDKLSRYIYLSIEEVSKLTGKQDYSTATLLDYCIRNKVPIPYVNNEIIGFPYLAWKEIYGLELETII